MHTRTRTTSGIGLIEIVIGCAVISIGMIALIATYRTYVAYAFANKKNSQVAYLLEEALEAGMFLRDRGWSTNVAPLSTTTTYYLALGGSGWIATTVPQYVDGDFLRSFAVSDVKRDVNGRIAASGTYDPDTKQITATVQYYQGHATTTRSLAAYMVNLYGN